MGGRWVHVLKSAWEALSCNRTYLGPHPQLSRNLDSTLWLVIGLSSSLAEKKRINSQNRLLYTDKYTHMQPLNEKTEEQWRRREANRGVPRQPAEVREVKGRVRLPGSNPVLLLALFSLAFHLHPSPSSPPFACPPSHPANSSPRLTGIVGDSELFTPHGPHSSDWLFPLPSSTTYLLSHSVWLAFSSLGNPIRKDHEGHVVRNRSYL